MLRESELELVLELENEIQRRGQLIQNLMSINYE